MIAPSSIQPPQRISGHLLISLFLHATPTACATPTAPATPPPLPRNGPNSWARTTGPRTTCSRTSHNLAWASMPRPPPKERTQFLASHNWASHDLLPQGLDLAQLGLGFNATPPSQGTDPISGLAQLGLARLGLARLAPARLGPRTTWLGLQCRAPSPPLPRNGLNFWPRTTAPRTTCSRKVWDSHNLACSSMPRPLP